MQETYEGFPVMGESVLLEFEIKGHYTGQVSGHLLLGINQR